MLEAIHGQNDLTVYDLTVMSDPTWYRVVSLIPHLSQVLLFPAMKPQEDSAKPAVVAAPTAHTAAAPSTSAQ